MQLLVCKVAQQRRGTQAASTETNKATNRQERTVPLTDKHKEVHSSMLQIFNPCTRLHVVAIYTPSPEETTHAWLITLLLALVDNSFC